MKPILIVVIVTLLALDWAALDDIITDPASSFFFEWLMLAVSAPLLFAAGYLLFRHQK